MAVFDIAILGASGQIGLDLMRALGAGHRVTGYARDPERARASFARFAPSAARFLPFDEFDASEHDGAVNAVGAGDRASQIAQGAAYMEAAWAIDGRVRAWLERRPSRFCVSISSGAVYGLGRAWPIPADAKLEWPVNAPDPAALYALTKAALEARHRARPDLAFYDLRVFGFFSPFIRLDSSFFLAELAAAVVARRPFRTPRADMLRDYIDGGELAAAIELLAAARPAAGVFDIWSAAPATKLDLLAACERDFELTIDWAPGPATPAPAPAPPSRHDALLRLGHAPKRRAREIVLDHLRALAR
ncbi:MAG: NAD(P)-dependent oxidoreductase [Tagaea sp.]|nr:NAD(P)-dependent oxidoreductase [Tagaea sp.]